MAHGTHPFVATLVTGFAFVPAASLVLLIVLRLLLSLLVSFSRNTLALTARCGDNDPLLRSDPTPGPIVIVARREDRLVEVERCDRLAVAPLVDMMYCRLWELLLL